MVEDSILGVVVGKSVFEGTRKQFFCGGSEGAGEFFHSSQAHGAPEMSNERVSSVFELLRGWY